MTIHERHIERQDISPADDGTVGKSSSLERHNWSTFLVALTVVTLVPIFYMPLAASVTTDVRSLVLLTGVFTFLGGQAHVGATYYFFADKTVREFFLAQKTRYIIVPSVLVFGTGILFAINIPALSSFALLFYFIWQTFHYQRQNYGILSFISSAKKEGRPADWETIAIDLAAIAGILGMIHLMRLLDGTFLEAFSEFVFLCGKNLYIVVALGTVAALAVSREDLIKGKAPGILHISCLLMSVGFFLPTFIFDSVQGAIMGYALAHGLQYFVFMYFVSAKNSAQTGGKPIITMVFIAFGIGMLMTMMEDQSLLALVRPLRWQPQIADGVFGMYLGLVMSHFVIDAGIWRLRERFQREYIGSAFAFVFNH